MSVSNTWLLEYSPPCLIFSYKDCIPRVFCNPYNMAGKPREFLLRCVLVSSFYRSVFSHPLVVLHTLLARRVGHHVRATIQTLLSRIIEVFVHWFIIALLFLVPSSLRGTAEVCDDQLFQFLHIWTIHSMHDLKYHNHND